MKISTSFLSMITRIVIFPPYNVRGKGWATLEWSLLFQNMAEPFPMGSFWVGMPWSRP